jgi:hypothetical protein
MPRRAGIGLLVGTILMAPSVASAAPTLLFEPYNGTIFYAEDADVPWFPASLTKLMTAYVAFEALKAGTITPDTKLICSKKATEQAPSKLWLKEGEEITLDDALMALDPGCTDWMPMAANRRMPFARSHRHIRAVSSDSVKRLRQLIVTLGPAHRIAVIEAQSGKVR